MIVFDNSDDCHNSPSDDDADDCHDFHGDNGADHNVKQNSVSNVEQSTPLDYKRGFSSPEDRTSVDLQVCTLLPLGRASPGFGLERIGFCLFFFL